MSIIYRSTISPKEGLKEDIFFSYQIINFENRNKDVRGYEKTENEQEWMYPSF